MAVLIGHASIDENGGVHGGTPGDQNGKEVFKQNWWDWGWTVLLRPVEANIGEKIADACEAGCDNDKIGYSWDDRNSFRTQAQKVGFDLSKINTACQCDCSAFATVCAEAAGVNMNGAYTSGNAPTTSNMRSKFVATGKFKALTDSKYLSGTNELQRGDILVKEGTHTVIVLSNGANIKVQEPGNVRNNNELAYRAHIQTYGTLNPVRDGQTAGTIGRSRRLEGFWIDLRILRKTFPNLKLSGKAHVQTIGDIVYSNIEHDTCVGTTGRALRLEAFLLNISGLPSGKKLYYRSHLQGIGWQAWKTSGQWSGTQGESRRIEAIQIYIS